MHVIFINSLFLSNVMRLYDFTCLGETESGATDYLLKPDLIKRVQISNNHFYIGNCLDF